MTIKRMKECYVEVTPDMRWSSQRDPAEEIKQARALMEKIAASVRRHCDDVLQVRPVLLTEDICSFCGYDPETDPKEGPCCCDKAIAEWKSRISQEVKS